MLRCGLWTIFIEHLNIVLHLEHWQSFSRMSFHCLCQDDKLLIWLAEQRLLNITGGNCELVFWCSDGEIWVHNNSTHTFHGVVPRKLFNLPEDKLIIDEAIDTHIPNKLLSEEINKQNFNLLDQKVSVPNQNGKEKKNNLTGYVPNLT